MTTLYNAGDSIEGKKIYCEAERFQKPHRISTKGRHNAQQVKAEGSPARAIIDMPLGWVKK